MECLLRKRERAKESNRMKIVMCLAESDISRAMSRTLNSTFKGEVPLSTLETEEATPDT